MTKHSTLRVKVGQDAGNGILAHFQGVETDSTSADSNWQ